MTDRDELVSVNNQLKSITSSVDAYLAANPGGGEGPPDGGGGTPPPIGGATPIPTPGICAPATATQLTQGVTYYFPLPKTTSGAGTVGVSAEGGAGTGAQLQVGLALVPGDWATAQAHAQTQTVFGTTKTIYPYYQAVSGYASMPWESTNQPSGAAVVPPGQQYYFMIRIVNMSGSLQIQITSPGCN